MKYSKTLSYKKTFDKKLFFKYLLLSNSPGVYAFINEKDKKIFIGASNDPIKTIGVHISALANKTHHNKALKRDRDHLRMEILCHCEAKYKEVYKLIEIDKAIKNGYSLYNIENIPQYTARIRLTYREPANLGMEVSVQLVNRGKRVFTVKTFDKRADAEAWLEVNSNVFEMLKMVIDNGS